MKLVIIESTDGKEKGIHDIDLQQMVPYFHRWKKKHPPVGPKMAGAEEPREIS